MWKLLQIRGVGDSLVTTVTAGIINFLAIETRAAAAEMQCRVQEKNTRKERNRREPTTGKLCGEDDNSNKAITTFHKTIAKDGTSNAAKIIAVMIKTGMRIET